MSCGLALSEMGTVSMDNGIESPGSAMKGFQAHGAGDISRQGEALGLLCYQCPDGSHHGRAIGQCQPLFRHQRRGSQASPAHNLSSR